MFLSELKIWNFRKYGSGDSGAPGLYLKLNKLGWWSKVLLLMELDWKEHLTYPLMGCYRIEAL